MDKQVQLNLSKAKQLDDNHFQIQIGTDEYKYQVPDNVSCKDAVNKINRWVDKGVSQWGGLYDYIKRNFKLILESQKPYHLLENDGSTFDITIDQNKVTLKYLTSTLEYYSDTINGVTDFIEGVKSLDTTVLSPEVVSNIIDLASRFLNPIDYDQLADFLKTAFGAVGDVDVEPEEVPEDIESSEDDISPEDTLPSTEEQMPESQLLEDYQEQQEQLIGDSHNTPVEDPDLSQQPSDSEENPEEDSEIDVEDLDNLKDAAAALDLGLYILTNDEKKYYVVGRISPNDGSYEYLDLEENKFLPLPLNFEGLDDINTLKTKHDIEVMAKELDELQQIIMDLDMEVFIDE